MSKGGALGRASAGLATMAVWALAGLAGCGADPQPQATWTGSGVTGDTQTGDLAAPDAATTADGAGGDDLKQVEIIVFKPDAEDTQTADETVADTADTAEPVDAILDATPDTTPDADTPDSGDTAGTDAIQEVDATPTPCTVNCNDGNPCTIDECQGATCKHSPAANCGPKPPCASSADCAKGSYCDLVSHACTGCASNGDCGSGAWCKQGQCTPAQGCKSDTECKASKQLCNKAIGLCVDCLSEADCAANEVCQNSACLPVKACKSSKDCAQVCDSTKGICVACTASSDCAPGEFCSGGQCLPDLCSKGACAGATAFACASDGGSYAEGQSCNDNSPCTTDSCQDGTCLWTAVASTTCDDGNACTNSDTCTGGKCAGTTVSCDDKNPCTADTCDPGKGCQHAPTSGTCDDGDPCTESDTCAAGKCTGTPKVCDDGNECTDNTCKFGTCVYPANSAPCGASATCSACVAGKCTAGISKGVSTAPGPGYELRSALPAPGGGYSGAGAAQLPATEGGFGSTDGWLVLLTAGGGSGVYGLYGGPGDDSFAGHLATSDGYLLYGSQAVGKGSAGWLVRTKADAKIVWDKTFDEGGQPVEGRRAIAWAGGWVLGGTLYSGTEQGWLVRVDADGNKLWTLKLPAITSATGLAVWPDGSLAVAGASAAGKLVVQRISGAGAILNSTAEFAATGVADALLSSAGTLVVYGNLGTGSPGLAAFDSTGKNLWSKTFAVSDLQSLGRVTTGPNGGFVVSAVLKTAAGALDGWLAGLDAGGALVWSHNYGGLSDDPLYAVTNVAGRLYAAGSTKLFKSTGTGWIYDLNEVGMMGCQCENDAGCDDKNACTYEFCNLGLCFSFNQSSGTTCGSGGKCDGNGTCK